MEAHEEFLKWAKSQGVELDGIVPRRIPGRGIGIVATRRIKPDEVILQVPVRTLRTMDTVPKKVSRKLPRDLSIHGLLAADVALDRTDKYAKWNAVVPSAQDLATLPLSWVPQLQELLPCRARQLLAKQQAKFGRDWAAVSAAFPALCEADYRYAWLLVNTRTFYYVCPRTERLSRDDRMVLQPVADLFNHADAGCSVAFDEDNFAIAADRAYRPGEEVFISYGAHPDDFLLLEYGFVLGGPARNRWDEACLDDALLPRLSARHRRLLRERGFLGGYALDARTACHRTEVALRLLCLPAAEWRRFADGADDGAASQEGADALLRDLLVEHAVAIRGTVAELEQLAAGEESQRMLLKARWLQILALVEGAVERLGS